VSAIVGGGPAGMACAHDLRRLGYQVTVYEATDKLGGAMWLGIPEYRLDRSVLAADIDDDRRPRRRGAARTPGSAST
jgi:NADPH-dependent glutamate synthase beta subunit-like oxidoreductase